MQRHSPPIVLEPATSFDLVTLSAVKAYLNITSTTDDARLQALIAFSSKVIADYCDRVFALEKVVETIHTESNVLALDSTVAGISVLPNRYPVREIDSILVDGVGTDYILDWESGVVRGALAGEMVITYTAGYDLPEDAPGPLSMACMDFLRQSLTGASTRDPGIRAISDNATGSISFWPPPGVSISGRSSSSGGAAAGGSSRGGAPLSSQATALIQPYRRIALA
jgi:hypothetical protein